MGNREDFNKTVINEIRVSVGLENFGIGSPRIANDIDNADKKNLSIMLEELIKSQNPFSLSEGQVVKSMQISEIIDVGNSLADVYVSVEISENQSNFSRRYRIAVKKDGEEWRFNQSIRRAINKDAFDAELEDLTDFADLYNRDGLSSEEIEQIAKVVAVAFANEEKPGTKETLSYQIIGFSNSDIEDNLIGVDCLVARKLVNDKIIDDEIMGIVMERKEGKWSFVRVQYMP